ncbi:MAG: potassium/proton antiporter [Actinobacteria bacterium]|nr:potassium/proton antiporter [Actinomycetota bacterium]
MEHSDSILLAGVLLALAIGVSLMATRMRMPGLVVFLMLGIAVGPHGLGIVDFVDEELAQTVGVIALALILFEGGLASGWTEIRPVARTAASLATIGTLLTALITGFGAAWLLDFSTLQALLIGAIVASTDGAAVFALLRGSMLRKRVARTLEAEAGMNDPVAILLVLGFIDWIQLPGYGAMDMLGMFASEMSIGGLVGVAVGFGATYAMRAIGNVSSGLYPVATIAAAATAFGLAHVLHGSGFLAVYLAGLVLGSGRIPNKRAISDFHDGVAWVSQITVFMILGLLFAPSSVQELWDEALIVTLLLMFAARPVAVFAATILSRFEFREVVLLQWAGMRGAVPIVLATFPPIAGIADAGQIFNIVFFVVIASAVFQGSTFEPLARRLGLMTTRRAIEPPLIQVGNVRRLGAEFFEFPVRDGDAIVGHMVNELQLPREALVSVIVRGQEALLPRGSTELAAGDRLHILLRGHLSKHVEQLFETWRDGPIGREQIVSAPVAGHAPIFSVKPWTEAMGDAGDPSHVGRSVVRRRLRTRHDAPGSLVALDDGRYAVAGDGVVATGSPRQLRAYAVRRIERAESASAKAWWQEIAGAMA